MYKNYETEEKSFKERAKRKLGSIVRGALVVGALAVGFNQCHAAYTRSECREVSIVREDPELMDRIESAENISDISYVIEEKKYCMPNKVTDYIDRLAGGQEILDYKEMR